MSRHAVSPQVHFFPQPVYLVGMYKEDGRPTFSMHTWMCAACFRPPTLMFSVYGIGQGVRKTADRVIECGAFSVNLVSTDMLRYADYCGSTSGYYTDKVADARIPWGKGQALDVPVLDESPWVYECRLAETKPVGDCTLLFGEVRHVLVDDSVGDLQANGLDVPSLRPAVYGPPNYYALGPQVYSVKQSLRERG